MVFSKPIRALGMAWYREDEYSEILKVMIDASVLPRTFEAWEKKAFHEFTKYRSLGYIVDRAYIDPETFPGWCGERGLDINAEPRKLFGFWFVAGKYKSTH